MIEGCSSTIIGISRNVPLLTTATHDPNTWNFFLFLFIIASVFAIIVLLSYSKKPNDWQHKSVVTGYYSSGRLKDLAESIKITSVDYYHDTPIKRFAQNLFFQKVQSVRGLLPEEFEKLTQKDRTTLEVNVQDKEIVDWILNVRQNQAKSSSWFKKGEPSKKDQYLMDLKIMVDKMEAWGE